MAEVISTLQLKRGTKENLIRYLRGQRRPLAGEPILEIDTNRLKFGDGVLDYEWLPYFQDAQFEIKDPLSGQILVYNEDLKIWVNKKFVDEETIKFVAGEGLKLKGYENARHGQMLIKDATLGLNWIDPVTNETMTAAVQNAQQHAAQAGEYEILSGNHAVEALRSANQAQLINEKTVEFVNNKFW